MRRNPIYIFQDTTSIGIYDVPLKSTVHIVDAGNGFPMFIQLVKKDNLDEYSTIQDLLDNPDDYIDITASGSSLSQLEKIIEEGKQGWRLYGRDPLFYGNIGTGAIDFSENSGSGSGGGATGDTSFAVGLETTAEGRTSFASGKFTSASGENSFVTGYSNIVTGDNSAAFGYNTKARKENSIAFGRFNEDNLSGILVTVGAGMDNLTRENVFEVYDDGGVRAPGLTTIGIDSHPKSLVTQEYVTSMTDASQLQKITEVDGGSGLGHTGWRILGRSPLFYGWIGEGAIDFSESNQVATFAPGYGASGFYSFATGQNTVSSGNYSFVAGLESKATADYASAFGQETLASGASSNTEGYMTIASGITAHAEGSASIANGKASHAEGDTTKATKDGAHSEGILTEASGEASHAEGYKTKALGNRSHAEGDSTSANGHNSHAEGIGTIALNNNSHACGRWNRGTKDTNILEVGIGSGNTDRKNALEIDDQGNITAPRLSIDMINNNLTNLSLVTKEYVTNAYASELEKVALSMAPDCSGTPSDSFAYRIRQRPIDDPTYYADLGREAIDFGLSYSSANGGHGASGYASFAEGVNTLAKGCYSHAAGFGTIAENENQFVVGSYNKADPDSIFVVGNGINTNPSNAIVVYKDGQIIAPNMSPTIIDDINTSNRVLITKEYLMGITGGGKRKDFNCVAGMNDFIIPGVVKVTDLYMNGAKLRESFTPTDGFDYSVINNGTDTIISLLLVSGVHSGDWIQASYYD